jgi:hypothetical protein
MENKFGPLETTKKATDIDRDEIFQENRRFTLFDHGKMKEFWKS